MIVTQTDTGWQIINQQAHGLLAMQLALQWKAEKRPKHWIETLAALTEHDDGQLPWTDRNHLTAAGTPLSFQIQEYSIDQCRNMLRIGLQKSRWNALMMSMHTSFLYEPKRGTDKMLDEFLDQQIENQRSWRSQYKAPKTEADYAYSFVQWCDALSLILCLDQIPPEKRRLEISVGPDGVSYFIFERDDNILCIDPWPFANRKFSVHVETFNLTQLAFESDEALDRAIQQADMMKSEWKFSK